MNKEKLNKLIESIKKEKLSRKYLHSISYFEASNQLRLEWLSNKNIFKKFIKKMVQENQTIKDGYFVKNDGSCNAEIVLILN